MAAAQTTRQGSPAPRRRAPQGPVTRSCLLLKCAKQGPSLAKRCQANKGRRRARQRAPWIMRGSKRCALDLVRPGSNAPRVSCAQGSASGPEGHSAPRPSLPSGRRAGSVGKEVRAGQQAAGRQDTPTRPGGLASLNEEGMARTQAQHTEGMLQLQLPCTFETSDLCHWEGLGQNNFKHHLRAPKETLRPLRRGEGAHAVACLSSGEAEGRRRLRKGMPCTAGEVVSAFGGHSVPACISWWVKDTLRLQRPRVNAAGA